MRIGLDIDGVLANFIRTYERLFVSLSGRNLFPAFWPEALPPCWDWPQHYGYTNEEAKAVWAVIKTDPNFWLNLEVLPGAAKFLESIRRHAAAGAEVYFVTDRPGVEPLQQTHRWLQGLYGPLDTEQVIVSGQKGDVAAALRFDYYLDDKLENVLDVQAKSPTTLVRLLDFPYNASRPNMVVHAYDRVSTLAEFEVLIGA